MGRRVILILFSIIFLQVLTSQSQTLVIDTVAKNYYIKYQINDTSGVKDGSYEMIYKGKTLTKGSYKNGWRIGEWAFTGMNDTLEQKGEYFDGQSGEWKFHYPDGKLSCIMSYTLGVKNGVFKSFFHNGNPSFETNYISNKIQGVSTQYYENGKVAEVSIYVWDTLNGPVKSYFETGTLKEERNMKGRKKEGDYHSYFMNGMLRQHLVYLNGNPYNVIASNDKDGKPINSSTFKDGNGIFKLYDLEGNLQCEEVYKNSIQHGYSKYWKKGILIKEGKYENGEYDSLWVNNFPSGELNSKVYYKNGKKEGEAVYYFKSGSISQKGQHLADEKFGAWVNYDEKGVIASELNFKNDMMEGEAKYFENGKLWRTGKYNKGVKIYVWTDYDKRGKEISVYDYGYTFVKKDEIQKSKANATTSDIDPPFTITEKMPSFPGGEKMMMEFIQENVRYPQLEKESGTQGTVYITFVVNNLGEIDEVRILRGVSGGPGCDKEGMRVVKAMPRWSPGVQNGRPVRVQFNLPIKYRLK